MALHIGISRNIATKGPGMPTAFRMKCLTAQRDGAMDEDLGLVVGRAGGDPGRRPAPGDPAGAEDRRRVQRFEGRHGDVLDQRAAVCSGVAHAHARPRLPQVPRING